MATNFRDTKACDPSRRESGNFSIPMTLLCSGLMSATAWAAIAAVVMILR